MKTKLLLFLTLITFGLSSCIQDNFDNPPVNGTDPDMTATITLADLKAMYTGTAFEITDSNLIVNVVVHADDKTGNFYKTLVVDDGTAGISIRMDQTSLFNQYPVGRRIFIKLKGLWIGEYNGLIQLGAEDPTSTTNGVAPIPSSFFDDYFFKGTLNNPLTIVSVASMTDLDNSHQNRLVQITGVQFLASDTNGTYADAVTLSSLNRTLEDASGNNIIVRTSGYADFASTPVAKGSGEILAIYTVFGATPQLVLRSTSDVKFTNPRLTISNEISVQTLRGLYSGSTVSAPNGKIVRGVVISDRTTNNLNGQNFVIQNGEYGIVIRLTATNSSINLGDSVAITTTGGSLGEFGQVLQLSSVPIANVSVVATGRTVTPRLVTVQEALDNQELWESTLIRIMSCTIASGTYSGNKNVTDASNTIVMYTATGASFAGTTVPAGSVDITAILSQFNSTKQIQIRNTSDIN